ncbi:MAG: PAS domain S-box protein [Candidatus Aminicenantales bacterium]
MKKATISDTPAKRLEKLARLATFPEFNPEPVLEVDAAGRISYLNRAARRLFRGILKEGAGHPWLAGLDEAAKALRKSRKRSITRELQVGDRWFLWSIWSPPEGDRFRIYGRDISARKKAEDALRASEQDYRDLVDNANSIILRWKPSGEITYSNRFAQEFFGYSEKDFLGRRVTTLVPETDSSGADLSRLADEIVARPEVHKSQVNENVLRDGRRVLVQWTNRALSDDAGNVREVLAIGNDITARMHAEVGLREARDYLDNLFNYASAPIIVWDARSRITRFNRAFEALTGRTAQEVLGREIEILFPGDLRAESLRRIRRTISEGERWEAVEIAILHKDGSVRTVLWNSANILGPDGKTVVAAIAQGQDITERKLVEDELLVYQAELEEKVRDRTAELARSAALLERMFASVDLSIASIDGDFNVIRVNRAFADAFGGTPESYFGKSLFALLPGAGKEAVFRRVLETGEPHVELESPLPDVRRAGRGPSFWDWSLQPVAAGEGTKGLVLSLVDVTPRIKAEEERRRLSTAVEQSSEGIVITDAADHILYVNQTFQDLHGLDRADILGRKYGDILRFDMEEESFKRGIRECLDAGEVWKGRLTRAIGGLADRKLDVTISPVRDPSGQVVNHAILERDMTHEHRLEASVRYLQKMDALGTLAGGIAHDFNNILVPIFINAELAAFDAESESPTSRYLDLILEAANRGRELIKQIIAFSRPAEQKRDLVDLAPVVREAVKFLQSSIPKSIAIRERIDAAPEMVRADPTQIHQVVMNLGSNAAYAMREAGGRLDVGLSEVAVSPETAAQNPGLRPGPYIKLTVEDTGTGMTRDVQDRIFDPFFTTKRRGEGTGMGLPVVLGIVRSHGGAIMVSTTPGKGTTFEVYIPAAKGGFKAAPPVAERIPKGKGRVLFVDDEDMLIRTVPRMLERLGYTVTAVSDPLAALALFRQRPQDFELVITDETMPGLSGEKLAREMLTVRPGIPIILSTGYSEAVREEEIRALGIREFIMKPFSTGEIAEKIQAALKKS